MKQVLESVKRKVQSKEAQCPNCKSIGSTFTEVNYGNDIKKKGSVIGFVTGCAKCNQRWFNEYKFFRKKSMDGKIIEPKWAVK